MSEPVPTEATVAAAAAVPFVNRDALLRALAAAAPAIRAAEKARIIAFVEQRAKDINGKGCGADVEELYALADLLRGDSGV